ncbi:MAG TPA: right-handed parallel beta-helix repeat-containing protein [Pseudobdellovibrionaceae bacterium]|jgi:hypothetical protein
MEARKTILGAMTMLFTVSAFADDCDSIRKAINDLPPAGGTVLIDKGIYNCGAPIIINRSNVNLKGAGQNKVTLRLIDHVHAPLLIIGEPKTVMNEHGNYVAEHRVENIRVSGLTLDGNRANHDPSKECGETICEGDPSAVRNNGITIRGASKVLVENVTTHSMISGGLVTEKYCDQLIIRNFNSYDNYFDGFAGYETEHSVLSGLYLHNNRGAGISIDINFNNNIIRDSKLHDNGDVGIFARNLSGNQFKRLSIQRSGNHGVFLASAEAPNSCAHDNQFEAVLINGSKRSGFRLNNNCQGNRITGASNLCGNAEGGFSEDRQGTLLVADKVSCR